MLMGRDWKTGGGGGSNKKKKKNAGRKVRELPRKGEVMAVSGPGRRRCGPSAAIPRGRLTKPGSIPGKARGGRGRGGARRRRRGGGLSLPGKSKFIVNKEGAARARSLRRPEPPGTGGARSEGGAAAGSRGGRGEPRGHRPGAGLGRGGAAPGVALPFPEASPPERGAGESGPAGAGREKGEGVRGESAGGRGKGDEEEEEGAGLHLPARRGAPAALKPTARFYSPPPRNKKVAIY